MLEKRIIICLDVRDGKTTKGIKFKGNIDIGDPVEMAKQYYDEGVDELDGGVCQVKELHQRHVDPAARAEQGVEGSCDHQGWQHEWDASQCPYQGFPPEFIARQQVGARKTDQQCQYWSPNPTHALF